MATVWSGVNTLGRPGNRPSSTGRLTPVAMRRLIASSSACAAQAITCRIISPIIWSMSVRRVPREWSQDSEGAREAKAHPAPVQGLDDDGHQFDPIVADLVQGGDGDGIRAEQPGIKAVPSGTFTDRDGAGDSHV